ncbi:hypothetical protein [Nonomuraea sp. NPDC049141]|uniref:hypothetical protein n=1 Tax=Nonomuraea sp. NPDC049141 TaxID=3155500 RepID=UPI0033F60D2F
MQTPSVLGTLTGLPLAEQVIIMGRTHTSMALSLRQIADSMAALVGEASSEDLEGLAHALDGQVDVVQAVTRGVNVVTLLQGLKVLEYLEDLPMSGVADVAEARQARGAQAWEAVARCLLKASEIAPLDGPAWEKATPSERATFAEAFAYAQTIVSPE